MKNIEINYFKWIKENVSNDSHSYFLPTYEQCREICDANGNLIFYETKHEVDGYPISIFNYRLAQVANFIRPVDSNPVIKANELRGLTFVFHKDGTLYKRFLLLDKFWNLNQEPQSAYSVVQNYKIRNIYDKLDGSIASFIQLPSGRVIGRSKASFISDQAIEIEKIYNRWSNIKKFIDWCMNEDIIPIMEYVAPSNRIVVSYANTDLVLLRMRDNNTGEYLNIEDHTDKLDGISVAQSFSDHSLDTIQEVVIKMVGSEGVIVQFENGKMIKIKSPWYIERHKLFTQDLNHESTLIKMIIEETIDDVIPYIDDIKRKDINRITNIINIYIKNTNKQVKNLIEEYTDIKTFAIKYSKSHLFPIAIGVIKGKDIMDLIKNKILTDTKNLMSARKWITDHDI